MASALLQINCGYARTAVRQLSLSSKSQHKGVIHRRELEEEFFKLFDRPTYNISYPRRNADDKNWSNFDKHCDIIFKHFNKKWHPPTKRVEYTHTFSIDNWKSLTDEKKSEHTLAECKACYLQHQQLQKHFPGKHVDLELVQLLLPASTLTKQKEKEIGKKVLQEVDKKWENQFGRDLTSMIPKLLPEANLTPKLPKSMQKRQGRAKKRTLVAEVNQQFAKNATLSVLAEAESMAGYKRKRLALSFEQPAKKKQKSHSPLESSLDIDIDKVLTTLKDIPNIKNINWSKQARELGFCQKNGGQVLKEIAIDHGIFIIDQENTPTQTRRGKAKLSGQEISMPCLPTEEEITKEKKRLIDSGELSIGEPCTPFTISKVFINNDLSVETKDISIFGRKIPLSELRQRLLKKHEQYMRLSRVADMNRIEIIALLKTLHIEHNPCSSVETLREILDQVQRKRSLTMWHDHSTILQTGYILFALSVVYDPAVFLTEREYRERTGKNVDCIQTFVEDPEIYMIAPSTSSGTDQIALISDRLECLADLNTPCKTSNGTLINDTMRFFCGDKPAQQFERGTQVGGTFKCGGCGCKDQLMHDQAHALRKPWRSIRTLQTLVINGKYGLQKGVLKPLHSLKVNELREELSARGIKNVESMLKPALQDELDKILQGAQRVPSLLTLNPTQCLEDLNLNDYEILDCEPLHDVKGHLLNLLPEIPKLLQEPLKTECQNILDAVLPKQKVSGAVLRTAAIKLHIKLSQSSAQDKIKQLLDTIVRITEVLYMKDSKRNPKIVLRLYNLAWLHHELVSDLLYDKTSSNTKMFGSYLHSLTIHAPLQYQIVSLLSVNAENQERLFSQAKRISLRATNRKVENILPTILLSIQARQKNCDHKPLATKQSTIVSSVACKLQPYKGTSISKEFVAQRLHSWQAHLERISTFLIYGEKVWWTQNEKSYIFLDSDDDSAFHTEGPKLLHFRATKLPEIEQNAKKVWEKIISDETLLPTPLIRIFNDNGDFTGTRKFCDVSQATENTSNTYPELTEEEYRAITLQPQIETTTDLARSNKYICAQQNSTSPCEQQTIIDNTLTPQTHFSHNMQPFTLFTAKEDLVEQNKPIDSESESTTIQSEKIIQLTLHHQNIDEAHSSKSDSLTTTAGRLIEGIIGRTYEVQKLDRLRTQLRSYKKQNKMPTKSEKSEYTFLLQKLKTGIDKELKKTKAEIRQIEKNHYHQHNTFPTTMNLKYKHLRKKLDKGRYIQTVWETFLC